jgi:GT2 family glycosyltransferase
MNEKHQSATQLEPVLFWRDAPQVKTEYPIANKRQRYLPRIRRKVRNDKVVTALKSGAAVKALDCTASIVAYNNPPDMIRKAVKSFLSCSSLDVELHIVDNSKRPALKSSLEDLPIKYHFFGSNAGYGKGHNKAIEECSASKYHVVMNPDVIIAPSTIEMLTAFMDQNPDIGMVCPKILNPDGTIQFLNKRYPAVIDLFIRRFLPRPFSSLFQRRLDRYEMNDIGYDTIYDVEAMTGAFMFCRTEVLALLGGFDHRYFLYFEDFDLGRKFQQFGYRTVFYPYAEVTHLWDRAAHKKLKEAFELIISMCKYFNKWGWKIY